MKALPLNIAIIGKSPEQIKKLVYLYNKPFNFEQLENNEWYPSEKEKEYLGEESYYKMIRTYKDKESKIYFKNVTLAWDSCDCGDGYGCSHGSWVYEIYVKKPDHIKNDVINRIKNIDYESSTNRHKIDNWVFTLEDSSTYCTEHNCFPLPKTLGDFISDCYRVNVDLEWSELISKLYFEENSNILQLILF